LSFAPAAIAASKKASTVARSFALNAKWVAPLSGLDRSRSRDPFACAEAGGAFELHLHGVAERREGLLRSWLLPSQPLNRRFIRFVMSRPLP
jgi:hypothetical protein